MATTSTGYPGKRRLGVGGLGTNAVKTLIRDEGFYTHHQDSAATEWTINHTLLGQPNVTVVDSAGTQVEGEVFYISETQVRVRFSAAFSGKAYLS
jgi:hypothetical protein